MFTAADHESSERDTLDGALRYRPAAVLGVVPELQLLIVTVCPGQTVVSCPKHKDTGCA